MKSKKQSAKEVGLEFKLSAAGLILSQGLLCSVCGSSCKLRTHLLVAQHRRSPDPSYLQCTLCFRGAGTAFHL